MKYWLPTRFDNHSIGLGLGILSAAFFGLTAALVIHVAMIVSATEIILVRGIIGLLILTPLVIKRLPILVKLDVQTMWVWVWAVAGAVSNLCFSWNLQHTDVGSANILFNISLIFVLLTDYLRGQARGSIRTIVSGILVVAGISIYWYGAQIAPDFKVMMVGFIGAGSAAIAYFSLSKASRSNDPWLIVWTVSLMSIPVSLLAKSGNWVAIADSPITILIVIALGALVGHYLLNLSFSKLSLPLATALAPSSLIWSVLFLAVFNSIIPSAHALLGVMLYVIGMGLLIADSKTKVTNVSDLK